MDLPIKQILLQELASRIDCVLTPEVLSAIVADVLTRCYPGPVDFSAVEPQRVGSYTLSCARIADLLPELRALHDQHWRETETHREPSDMNPDYDRVLDLEAQGRYFLVVARHDDGTLVGNYGSYLSLSSHTRLLTATEDTLFISAAHRRGRLGVSMIRYCEYALWKLAVSDLNVSVKEVNTVGPMLERMDYLRVGTQYTKRLKGPDNVLR